MLLFLLPMIAALCYCIYGMIQETNKQKKVNDIQEQKYNVALTNWEQRVKALKINIDHPFVYQEYSTGNGFFAVHIWREENKLMTFYAKPYPESYPTLMNYPEQIKVVGYEVQDCYRTGSVNTYVETDTSRVDALHERANYSSGLERLKYEKQAREAIAFAPTRIVENDTRRTILVTPEGREIVFRIDAYERIINLFPELMN